MNSTFHSGLQWNLIYLSKVQFLPTFYCPAFPDNFYPPLLGMQECNWTCTLWDSWNIGHFWLFLCTFTCDVLGNPPMRPALRQLMHFYLCYLPSQSSAEYRQNAMRTLLSSELGPPTPSSAGECCSQRFRGGHTHLRERRWADPVRMV